MNTDKIKLTTEVLIKSSLEKAWDYYSNPEHVVNWNYASDDWHCPSATSDFKVGGKFSSRMEAKDGSFGFDFGGTYTQIKIKEKIEYLMGDGRTCTVNFNDEINHTRINVEFEAESENSPELQRNGWQAILDNYKKYIEKN